MQVPSAPKVLSDSGRAPSEEAIGARQGQGQGPRNERVL